MINSEWQAALQQTRNLRDKLGRKVDKEIEETVAVMQLMNIHTTMSCGGHLDRDTSGPYITFGHKDISQYKRICNEINDPANKEFKIAVKEAKRLTFLEREKIWQYLEEFYKNRDIPYGQRLTVEVRPFSNNLFCQGAVNASFKNLVEHEAALFANRQEMMEFTEYLKSVYFRA